MTYYWDSSAVVNAVVSQSVKDRLEQGEHWTRRHTFAELFSVLTGRGIFASGSIVRLSASDVFAIIQDLAPKFKIVELDLRETIEGYEQAGRRGVQGGRIHDYEHALACDKAKADIFLTRDQHDFKELTRADIQKP